jgi:hypothetical protein
MWLKIESFHGFHFCNEIEHKLHALRHRSIRLNVIDSGLNESDAILPQEMEHGKPEGRSVLLPMARQHALGRTG